MRAAPRQTESDLLRDNSAPLDSKRDAATTPPKVHSQKQQTGSWKHGSYKNKRIIQYVRMETWRDEKTKTKRRAAHNAGAMKTNTQTHSHTHAYMCTTDQDRGDGRGVSNGTNMAMATFYANNSEGIVLAARGAPALVCHLLHVQICSFMNASFWLRGTTDPHSRRWAKTEPGPTHHKIGFCDARREIGRAAGQLYTTHS